MEIKRDAYLQQLIERKDNGMIKVITGIRRCGKSFLLFTIFKRYLLEKASVSVSSWKLTLWLTKAIRGTIFKLHMT